MNTTHVDEMTFNLMDSIFFFWFRSGAIRVISIDFCAGWVWFGHDISDAHAGTAVSSLVYGLLGDIFSLLDYLINSLMALLFLLTLGG